MSPEDPALVSRAETAIVRAYRAHWRKILLRHVDGEDPVGERTHAFLSKSAGGRGKMARHFYGYQAACEHAVWSEERVRSQLAPWLRLAAESAVRDGLDFDEPEAEATLAAFVQREYVAVVDPLSGTLHVAPYPGPDSVLYDDFYERTVAGVSVGARLSLYLSSGDPYYTDERRWTEAAIRFQFYESVEEADDDEPWELTFEDHDDFAVIVDIREAC